MHMNIIQVNMCIKFESSITNTSGSIAINMGKKKYGYQLKNTWDISLICNVHMYFTYAYRSTKFDISIKSMANREWNTETHTDDRL